ncbi:MAG: hypothetical protein KDA44_10520 [Planctomycetales bacterium]|nr:hypothetical protein [Planctomycetales bacterium]
MPRPTAILAFVAACATIARAEPLPFTISPQTTVVVEQLTADGFPDFEAYLLQRGRGGVTPANNAAVLLWQALWPADLESADRRPVLDALGMSTEPDRTKALERLYDSRLLSEIADWLESSGHERADLRDDDHQSDDDFSEWDDEELPIEPPAAAVEVIDRALDRPWTSVQIPPLAAWLQRNDGAIETIVAATQRPRYWSPPPESLNDYVDSLIYAQLNLAYVSRDAARALSLRAMRHMGEGRLEAAWRDVLAILQLSEQISQGPFVVDYLVGVAIRDVACRAATVILHDERLSETLTATILTDLRALPPLAPLVDRLDNERLWAIEQAVFLATGQPNEILNKGWAMDRIVDWDAVMLEINGVYDRLVAATRIADRDGRAIAIEDWDDEIEFRSERCHNAQHALAIFFSREHCTQMAADVIVAIMTPALGAAIKAQDRCETRESLTVVAAALSVYRARHGAYPASLVYLAPEILPETPRDPYSNEPYRYERTIGGYLLYSVFENGVDDGGTDVRGEIVDGEWIDENEAPAELDYLEETDLVIRVPMPAFALPAPPADDD